MNYFTNGNPSLIFLLIIVFWVLPWKGYALWTSVKNNQKGWFVAIMILNTFGILEIIYIFAVAKKKWPEVKRAFIRFISPKKKPTSN